MIKKNDNVIVLTGKDRGKQGKVLRVYREEERILVEGANLKKKRERPRREGQKGQTIDLPHPIHISNVALYCSNCGKGVRTGTKMSGKNKVRVCKKCGKEI